MKLNQLTVLSSRFNRRLAHSIIFNGSHSLNINKACPSDHKWNVAHVVTINFIRELGSRVNLVGTVDVDNHCRSA